MERLKAVPDDFNPRPPHRGRLARFLLSEFQLKFQPTPPAQGATDQAEAAKTAAEISTHAPRTGGDGVDPGRKLLVSNFNPRPPHRGRQSRFIRRFSVFRFQPTPPAQGATLQRLRPPKALIISTHAPRTGGDSPYKGFCLFRDISTHAPRTGGDPFSSRK